MFSVVQYRAIDYVYEASVRQKLTMNWLVLPLPYHLDRTDLYPHTGTLPEVIYRTPWTRGTVISACKLIISGSILEDLMANGQPDLQEKFRVSPFLRGDLAEVVPSSNPASQPDLAIGEALWLLDGHEKETARKPWDETFSKATGELLDPRNQANDLCVKEEFVFVDRLLRFRERLPRLRAMLARLKTLTVPDPLLAPSRNGLSEDLFFRHCLPFEVTPVQDTESHGACFTEEFSRDPALHEEVLLQLQSCSYILPYRWQHLHRCLMLPVELESCHPKRQDSTSPIMELQESLQIVPESIEKNQSCLDMLRKDTPASLWVSTEVSCFETSPGKDSTEGQSIPLDPTHPVLIPANAPTKMSSFPIVTKALPWIGIRFNLGHQFLQSLCSTVFAQLYTQLETDLPLTPPCPRQAQPPPPHARPPCTALPAEQLSPVSRLRLVTDSTRQGMEEALWKAEKHLHVVLGLLLAEPQTCDPTVRYWPISEAYKLMTSERESHVTATRGQWYGAHPDPHAGFAEVTDGPASCHPEILEILSKDHSEVAETIVVDLCDSTGPVAAVTEDFLPLSFGHIDNILRECSGDTDCPGQPITPAQIVDKDAPGTATEAPGPSCQETRKPEQRVAMEKADTSQGAKPNPAGGLERGGRCFPVQEERPVHKHTPTRPSIKKKTSSCPVPGSKEDPDPLSTFIMMRSLQKARVSTPLQNFSCGGQTRPEPKMAPEPKEELKPTVDLKPDCVASAGIGSDVRAQEASRPEDTDNSQVVYVQASESQRRAYLQLQAVTSLCLSRARSLGLCANAYRGFSALTTDHTHFLLKQQQKQLSASAKQGEPSEKTVPLYTQVALIHLLVTARDLLLKCDLNTAIDYLERAKETNMDPCLGDLWTKLRVVQYLSQRDKEPNPKILALQQQMRAWMQRNRTQRPCPNALVITAVDSDSVRAMLVNSLSHITGVRVSAVRPEENCSKLDSRRVKESLQRCWCALVCGQHVGPDFPWHCFSLVVEYDQVAPSAWATVCRERGIGHVSVWTSVPRCEGDPNNLSLELDIPFSLLVTEGLLNYRSLLQMLESTYNMTVLERDYPHSLKMLGGTSHYSVITVDESTAVVIQELEELQMERSSESFVLRMTALSLQYSCCWVIFSCTEGQGSGYSFNGEVFNKLVLIYSAFVLFGLKSEDLDVKVLISAGDSDLAKWITQISNQTLMSSGRDPLTWLDRDWLSVMPSEEEKCLVLFPSVNPLVAQLMLRRAPSLQWLLGATLSELQELLPEVPYKVIKLFSDTTALYKLNVSHSPPTSPAGVTQRGSLPSSPWGIRTGDPHNDPETFRTGHISPCPEDQTGHCADEGLSGIRDFSDSRTTFQRTCAHSPWGANKTRETWFAGYEGVSLKETAWSFGETQNPATGNSLVGRPSLRHGDGPRRPGGVSSQVFQLSADTRPSHLTLPMPAGSQWNGKPSPFGHATRPTIGVSCEYRVAGVLPEFGGCLRSRPDMKRSAGSTEHEEGNSGLPQLKKGKLTYEKVPGRSDGQTRLTFF